MSSPGWIAVDLDGTLAHYDHFRGIEHIGEPVPAMVERVKGWLAEGKDVRIFTARVCVNSERGTTEAEQARAYISSWSFRVFGVVLPVTNIKDFGMIELWDDRAITVEPNTGAIVGGPPCMVCGENAIGLATLPDGRKLLGCMRCAVYFVPASFMRDAFNSGARTARKDSTGQDTSRELLDALWEMAARR